MAVINPLWKTDPVQYLVLWKFPQLAAFSNVTARERSTHEERQKLAVEAEAYREELRSLPDDDFEALLSQARLDEAKRYHEYREAEERKQVFNRPDAAADYQHWASASYWTLDETAALSFGKDPRVVTWKVVSPHTNISPFAKSFAARRDIVYRAGITGQLAQQTPPSVVIAWAKRMRVSMPDELVAQVESLGMQIADWKALFDQQKELTEQAQGRVAEERAAHMAAIADHSQSLTRARDRQNELAEGYKELLDRKDSLITSKSERIAWCEVRIAELESQPAAILEKPLGVRERESLLKLVIGMAMDGYGYDPKASRSPIAKELAGNLALQGLSIDEDTVRKYLAEGRGLLPGDETEQNG